MTPATCLRCGQPTPHDALCNSCFIAMWRGLKQRLDRIETCQQRTKALMAAMTDELREEDDAWQQQLAHDRAADQPA